MNGHGNKTVWRFSKAGFRQRYRGTRHAIIHRDLTRDNIFVDEGCEPKLIDFGTLRPEGEEENSSTGGASPFSGWAPLQFLTLTPGNAAPERLRGADLTTLTDIYSAGRVLKHLALKPRPLELEAIADWALAADALDQAGHHEKACKLTGPLQPTGKKLIDPRRFRRANKKTISDIPNSLEGC